VLAPSAAAELLQKRSGRTDPDGAGRLAEELGFLPLALDHAGAYCALDRLISFDVYRQKFHSRLAYVPPGAPYPISVAKSFDLAIEKAVATCSAAERLLGVCAYLAPERIPVDVISQVIREEGERAKALMALSGVSLIGFSDADEGLPTVSIHRLVQAAMRTRHYLRKQTDTEVQLAVTCLVAAMKTPKPISDETLDSTDKAYWYQLWALLPYTRLLPARKLGSTKPLHLYAKATVEFSDKLLPHAGLPPSVEYRELLADVLCAAGNFREAEQEYRRALQIAEGVLGHDHPKVASMLLNHGLRCVGRKNSEADRLFREALAIAERTLGTESPLAIHCRQINYYLSTRGRMRGFPKGMFMLLFWPLPANQADEDLAVGIAQYGVGAASLGLLYDLLLSWKEGTGVAFANLGAHLSLSAQIGLSISLSFFGAYLIFRLWRKRMSVGIAWASLIYFFVICDLGYLLIVGLYTVPLFLVVGVFLTKFMVDVVIAAYSLRRHLVPH
jgi:Tetratricopeptide repeat